MTPLNIVRRRKLLTGRDLAKRAGVSLATIYKVENRKSRPTITVVRKLAAALEVDPLEVDEFRPTLGAPAQLDLPEQQEAAAA
jgi:transcriptional regulator with XRE-family HTH domain